MKNVVLPIPRQWLIGLSLHAVNYTALDADGIPESCFLIRLVNSTDQFITFSFDGATSHVHLRPGTDMELNFQNNSGPNNFAANIRKGTVVYARGTTTGTGAVYLEGWYQPV